MEKEQALSQHFHTFKYTIMKTVKPLLLICSGLMIIASLVGAMDYSQANKSGTLSNLYKDEPASPTKSLSPPPATLDYSQANKSGTIRNLYKHRRASLIKLPPPPPLTLGSYSRAPFLRYRDSIAQNNEVLNAVYTEKNETLGVNK